jgi:branched-chain amino acid transport system ATP-binding protein
MTLEVRHLSKSYGGIRAVRDVSFTADAGELVGMIGPNGAGKTTCFNMLNGQIAPDAGEILLGGRRLDGLPPHQVWRHGVGRTFQLTQTFGSMTVRENVQMALLSEKRRLFSFFSAATGFQTDRADDLLQRVGMREQAQRQCAVLAYGDLKRVELAVALANRPKLLLMDEPTAGMAPKERIELMRLTARIARDSRMGVLFTEHDMDVVFEHADRIMVLNRGGLIAEGNPAEVRANEQVRAIYLGEGRLYHAEAS